MYKLAFLAYSCKMVVTFTSNPLLFMRGTFELRMISTKLTTYTIHFGATRFFEGITFLKYGAVMLQPSPHAHKQRLPTAACNCMKSLVFFYNFYGLLARSFP